MRNLGIRSDVHLKVKGRGYVIELVAMTSLSEFFYTYSGKAKMLTPSEIPARITPHTNSYESEGMLSFLQAAAMMWAFVVCDVSFTRLSILAYPSGGAIVRSSHIGGGNGSFHTV